jgi:hypothetical protein
MVSGYILVSNNGDAVEQIAIKLKVNQGTFMNLNVILHMLELHS